MNDSELLVYFAPFQCLSLVFNLFQQILLYKKTGAIAALQVECALFVIEFVVRKHVKEVILAAQVEFHPFGVLLSIVPRNVDGTIAGAQCNAWGEWQHVDRLNAFSIAHRNLSFRIYLDIVRVGHLTTDVDRLVVEKLNFREGNIGSFQVATKVFGKNGVIRKRNGVHCGAGREPADKEYSYKKFFNQIHVRNWCSAELVW